MKSAHAIFQSDAMSDQIRIEAELIRSLGTTRGCIHPLEPNAISRLVQSTKIRGYRRRIFQPDQNTAPLLAIRDAWFGRIFGVTKGIDPRRDHRRTNPNGTRARKGWDSLAALLGEISSEPQKTPLPQPHARLEAQAVTVLLSG